ncbi:iron complex outermembrane receptor protein [Chitinophaga terrae (ex Kim and Jung 2007)]|uniref:SusC/RagA family TonB-linked outer membrane protein n=1 Tax=Chitinophaga terrae (ex Kim and Jung 2007) TaxID=408074 RepID=UPI00277EF85F|nr:SusC/RagA family TonB-linked outer membrane protein [Chitinophaga terrae (ex Kim and Jung 2007)]MDQ0109946.1 iron complex outermembrane receptor protein [Chitinophaga terrae (ex Kim and Jung 2007)]
MNLNLSKTGTKLICTGAFYALMFLGAASPATAQQQRVIVQELHVKEGSLSDALQQLRKIAGIDIVYEAAALQSVKVPKLDISKQPVENVLRQLLKGTGYQFVFNEGVAVIKKEKAAVSISGTVTDKTAGAPLPGVSIHVLGTSTGTLSSGTGRFSLMADPATDTLVLSFMGFKTERIGLNGRTAVNVSMEGNVSNLNSVVVVGYGQTNKGDLTGAISHVSSESFNAGVFNSPEQLLQGKVAGLNVTRSGDPNATPSVTLRGPSTFRGGEAQQPFYVIDGVPGASIQLVSPSDIVSMDVLKDAASTAIYGARAANGVIMITTRHAKAGQSWVTYSGYGAIENVSRKIEMLSADELRKFLKDNGNSLAPSDEDNVSTDWQKEVTRQGISHSHNVSFGGGNTKTVFDGSVNYLKNDGIMKGSDLSRLNVRANLEQKAFDDRLKLNLAISNSVSTQNRIPELLFLNMLTYLPTTKIYNDDGSFKEDWTRTRNYLNPVSLIVNNSDVTKTKTMLGNARAELKLLEGLTYTASLSMQDEQINRDIYNGRKSGLAQGLNGRATRSAFTNTRKLLETYFNYDTRFGEHDLKLLAGYSWQEDRRGDGFQTSNQNFVSDATKGDNLSLGSPLSGFIPNWGNTRISTLRFISFYGRTNYAYRDKYLLQVSLRQDGSSAFGKNNRWALFPAFSGAWKVSKEPFMNNVTWINDLKIRAGYGVTGNSLGFDPLIAIMRYDLLGKFYYNGQYLSSISPIQNENPNLKWESTAMTNIGIDLAVLKNKLSFTIDLYNKITSDLIYSYNVPSTNVAPTMLANVGKMRNKGIELQVNATPVQRGLFSWNISANISHNNNEIVSLSNDTYKVNYIETADLGGRGQSGNYSQRLLEGMPLGTFYTLRYAGKDKDGRSQFYKPDGTLTREYSSSYLVQTGNAQPKLLYGLSNSFTYGDFDLNFFLRGVYGSHILNATLANLNAPYGSTATNLPKFSLSESAKDDRAYLLSDRYIESGSYLRLDNATIGYNIPMHNNKYVKKVRVYLSANNLFVITNYRGIDPEIDMGGLTPGIDNNNFYPKTRSFLLGLNASF